MPRRMLFASARMFLLAILCQTPLTALAAVGWTFRCMRGAALSVWWREGAAIPGLVPPVEVTQWPAIALAPRGSAWRAMLAPLWANLRDGLLGTVNVWTLTWPAAALWYFGWQYGWDTSFNKVYEHAFFGRTVSWFGNGLFLLAMLYVPIARARQAITGDWRAFWQWRAVLRLAWCSPHFLLLSLAYAAASLPILAIAVLPYLHPEFLNSSASDGELIKKLETYYFRSAFIFVPLYLGLHLLSARLYAAAILRALARAQFPAAYLHAAELAAFAQCGVEIDQLVQRPARPRRLVWLTAPLRAAAMLALWFVVVSAIYIAQFFNYQPARHWFNYPLVHLPWMKYVPDHLNATVHAGER